jgi:non-lysosomal glucosylceramidase
MDIPAAAWRRRLDQTLLRPGAPSPWALGSLFRLLPTYFRLRRTMARDRKAGRDTMLVSFDPRTAGPVQGVPLGGIGGGSVTRGWRGDFTRWQMRPGVYRYGTVPADQFSVCVIPEAGPASARVLYPGRPAVRGVPSAWGWGMDGGCATYHALFPRAWTVYEEPVPGVRLTCRQVSPVIPHDYRESSLPCGVFVWKVENKGTSAATIGLLLTFLNGIGEDSDLGGGHVNRRFTLDGGLAPVTGVSLRHRVHDPLTFAIAARADAGVTLSTRSVFDASGDGGELWGDFCADARLDDAEDERPSAPGAAVGAAVAATMVLAPGEAREVAFSLSWDMPLARFGEGRAWYRRYTRYYGREGDAAPLLARDALRNCSEWERRIEDWQRPVLADPEAPDWYAGALFNELYYVVDGGTIWTDGEEGEPAPSENEVGHFAYLEGHEYRMYNTYDVHFYASFALAMLWPHLELSLQRDFARALDIAHPETRPLLFSGRRVPRKVRGAIPHDLGMPGEDPWRKVNAYTMQDTSRWKDLNPKFVLSVCRDYAATGDNAFAAEMWPAVREAMRFMERFDRDGDDMIENEGVPDQTYDTWSVRGPSAYSGGLWLASLQAAAVIAETAGDTAAAASYRERFERGRAVFDSVLWNGEYYDYDASDSRQHDSIMADQMAGQWYARACGLPGIVTHVRARSALSRVFTYNVMRHRSGTMGAVNGMRPNGEVDTGDQQSQEVWTGTTYAVAAAMLQEGMEEEAMRTAQGVVKTGWDEMGYWFQMPEAWNTDGNYRALAYMRPLAIWAMQWARERVATGAGAAALPWEAGAS